MLANWQLPARGFVQPSPPPLSLRCRGLTFGSFSWAQLWSDLNSKNGNLPNFLSSFKCTENWGLNRTKFTAPLSVKKIMSDIKSKYKILLDPRAVVNAKKIVPLKNEELIPWYNSNLMIPIRWFKNRKKGKKTQKNPDFSRMTSEFRSKIPNQIIGIP